MPFTRAVRAGSPVIVALVSDTGMGKTYSALEIARGLAGPSGHIVGIDTEAGRMNHYGYLTEYYTDRLDAPYSPARYREKIAEAMKERPAVIVIDQASFEWSGTGGVLEMHDATGLPGGRGWIRPKAEHRKFVNALLECPVHIVVCLRGHNQFIQKGKDEVTIGPIIADQNKKFMFEVTVSAILDVVDKDGKPMLGVPRLVKCPAELMHAFPSGQPITKTTGQKIAEWVKGGAPVDHAFETLKATARTMAEEGTKALKAWLLGLTKPQFAQLKPIMDDLASAAKAADTMAAMTEKPIAAPGNDNPLDDDPLEPDPSEPRATDDDIPLPPDPREVRPNGAA